MLFNFCKRARTSRHELLTVMASFNRLSNEFSPEAVCISGSNLDGGNVLRVYLSRKEAKKLLDSLASFELDKVGPGC